MMLAPSSVIDAFHGLLHHGRLGDVLFFPNFDARQLGYFFGAFGVRLIVAKVPLAPT